MLWNVLERQNERRDPAGDEENDDDRLIIICARVDPGFKDEALVNSEQRRFCSA